MLHDGLTTNRAHSQRPSTCMALQPTGRCEPLSCSKREREIILTIGGAARKTLIMFSKSLRAAMMLMAASVMFSSCVGSFSLFNKLATWNKSATNCKFLNELIFIVISPAYAVCGLADMLVLNSIEFWSGSNPMTAKIGKSVKVKGEDGEVYAVKYLANGYEVTRPTGDVYYLLHDEKTDTWSMEVDGKKTELFRFNHDGTVKMTLPTGEKMDVAMDESGVDQLRDAVAGDAFMMATR